MEFLPTLKGLIARTYALTETTNYGLPLVTRQSLVMLLLEALPPVKPSVSSLLDIILWQQPRNEPRQEF